MYFSSNDFPLQRQMFRWRLPSPMCPQPITYPPTYLLAFCTNSFHFRMLKDMSQLWTRPSLLAAYAMSSRIFHMFLYSFSLVDMIESQKSGMEERNYPTSSVVIQSSKRWSVNSTGITDGCKCFVTEVQLQPSKYQSAFKSLPSVCFAFSTATKIFSQFFVLRSMTCFFGLVLAQLMSNFVMIPKVPYELMNSCLRSIPVLSFLMTERISRIYPLARTASIPIIFPRRGPCLMKYLPLA